VTTVTLLEWRSQIDIDEIVSAWDTSRGMTLRMPACKTIQWLLDGDPAIRWQVFRDLVAAPEPTVERERGNVSRYG